MATLKEHRASMVDLLANGSGIPASASRLAHAMHDVLEIIANSDLMQFVQKEQIRVRELNDATTPGLNDRALSKREKALKTDSPAKWPTPAEQRVKELENTIRQLKANNAKLKADKCELEDQVEAYRRMAMPEQTGCRKEDTQHDVADKALEVATDYAELGIKYAELVKILAFYGVDDIDKARAEYLKYNGHQEQAGCRKEDTRVCEHEWVENAELGRPLWIMCEKCGVHK